MSLVNRLLHGAPICRAKMADDENFFVDEHMVEDSAVDVGDQVKVVIAKPKVIEDEGSIGSIGESDRFFFKSTLASAPGGNDPFLRIPNKGLEKLDLGANDKIIYVIAPDEPVFGFNGPLPDVGKPVRNAAISASGRSSSPEEKDIERPTPTSEETTFSNAALFASGQVTLPKPNRDEIGVVEGDDVYFEAENEGNSITFVAKLGSGNRFNIPKDVQERLRVDASESTGDDRTKIDSITAQRVEE